MSAEDTGDDVEVDLWGDVIQGKRPNRSPRGTGSLRATFGSLQVTAKRTPSRDEKGAYAPLMGTEGDDGDEESGKGGALH